MKRILSIGVLCGLLATNTGCGLFQAIFCDRPYGNCGPCGPQMCSDGEECYGPTCRPVRHPVRTVAGGVRRAAACNACDCEGTACDSCGCESCGPCDGPIVDPCGNGCYGRCWHRGPLSCIFALFMGNGWWCGSPCGERYWGDFYSDPPDYWDSCDGQGNYTGGKCRSCGGGGDEGGSGVFEQYSRGPIGPNTIEGEPVVKRQMVSQTDRVVSRNSKPMQQPHRATRQ